MSDILPNYDASLKLQQQGWDAARPIGTMIKLPEKDACFCHGEEKHWHAYDAVWDGKNWLPVTSQAGIDLLMSLQDEGLARQQKAKGV